MTGLNFLADRAAMYKTHRTVARPPYTRRLLCFLPLSLLTGATPTRAAICWRLSLPNSGSMANKVLEVTGPIPGTLCKIAAFSFHAGVSSTNWASASSSVANFALSQRICSSISAYISTRTVCRRFFSTVSMSTICRLRVNSPVRRSSA